MPVPAECQSIADHIAELEGDRRMWQEELQQAAPGQKAGLARQIKSLTKQLAVAHNQLTDCLAALPPLPPPPPPLASTLSAELTLTTSHPAAPGPFAVQASISVIFDGPRTFIALTSFPAFAATFATAFGPNTTTITRKSGGTGSYSAGEIRTPVTLHFDQSIDLWLYEEDSDLPVILTTTNPGSPVDGNGAVTLVGSGTFIGGFLAGSTGTVTIIGSFLPIP